MPRKLPGGGRAAMDAVSLEREPSICDRPQVNGAAIEQLIFTLRAGSNDIVKVEKIEVDGGRRAMSTRDTAGFVDHSELNDVERALNEAFEAGLSGMLDPAGDDAEGCEAQEGEDIEDEEALRRAILVLIAGVRSRRRLHRRILERLLLSRVLRHQGRNIN